MNGVGVGDMVQVLSGLVAMMTVHQGIDGVAFRQPSLQWTLSNSIQSLFSSVQVRLHSPVLSIVVPSRLEHTL